MKRTLASAALLALMITIVPGHAATLAGCDSLSPRIDGAAPTVQVNHSCEADFTLAVEDDVTLTLLPGTAFTGTLSATVREDDPNPTVRSVSGNFINGMLVSGQSSDIFTLAADAYTLNVYAGTNACTPCVNAAAGFFGGEVTTDSA